MFVNVLCTIKHFRMRKASRSVIILYCNAEAAGFEPANRLRAVNCFRGSLLQPLGHASCYFIGTLSQTISIPLTPFSRVHIRPSCAPELGAIASLFFGRHLMMPCYLLGLCPKLSQFPRPPFQGGDQGLRAFHRHCAFPARQLRPGI